MPQQPQSRPFPWYGTALLIVLSPVLIALVLTLLAAHLTIRVILNALVWIFWCSRGRNVLYVYSDSPIWKEHIESNVIPKLGDDVTILNWSLRKQWRVSLATLLFRHFAGTTEFNPMALIFRPFQPRVEFRFWRPFQAWKKGNTRELEEMEHLFFELLSHLGQATTGEQSGGGRR